MKKVWGSGMLGLMMVLLSFGPGMAGNGKGPGDGTGPLHDITAGIPFSVTGDVVSLVPGEGLVVATEEGNLVIYGIGPIRYWNSLGVDRPGVGETIQAVGYVVDYHEVERYIAVTIIVEGVEVPLRDPVTGAPLWRGNR